VLIDDTCGQDVLNEATGRGWWSGRPLFSEPSRRWLGGAIDDDELVDVVAANYVNLVQLWRNRDARRGGCDG
jgi:myo-inositol catabolism protein IolC